MNLDSNIVLEDFSDKRKDELMLLSSPEKSYVEFLVGHLFKNLESDDDWYQKGINDLYKKGIEEKLLVKAIVVNGKTVGIIWNTGNQCDIFIHPNYAGRGYSRIAMGVFLKGLSGVSIGVSPYNLPSLKSIAHMFENENIIATDGIYGKVKINHKDLYLIINISESLKDIGQENIDTIIDEKVKEISDEKRELLKLFFQINSIQIRI